MILDKVIESLDTSNPCHKETAEGLQRFAGLAAMFFADKGEDLVEVVEGFCEDGRYPVVDKVLRVVAGCSGGFHEDLRALLCRYHAARQGFILARDDKTLAARYVADGHGYYVSSMFPKTVLAAETYRPDRFDKDLFLIYEVRHLG